MSARTTTSQTATDDPVTQQAASQRKAAHAERLGGSSEVPASAGQGAAVASTTSGHAPAPVVGGRASSGRMVAAGAIGNLIEWYDWAIYGFFAPVIASQFFPDENAVLALALTFATFAVGFVMRPLGGLLLGPFGDRHGRTSLLALTVGIMGAASLLIAVCPNYAAIGIAAPALLLVARLAQGLSAGAELGGAATFLVESARSNRRGLTGSWQQATTGLGALLASGIGAGLSAVLNENSLNGWGWRLPFAFGALLALVAVALRRGLGDPRPADADHKPVGMFEALTSQPRACVRVVAIILIETLTFYIWLVYLPTWAQTEGDVGFGAALTVSTCTLAVFVVLTPLCGMLSDRIGRRPLLLVPTLGFAVLTAPLLALAAASLAGYVVASLVGAVLSSMFSGVIITTMAEQFPTRVRVGGVAGPAALGVALFGGTAPLIITALQGRDIALSGIAVYTVVAAVVSGTVYWRMKETAHQPLS
jgi:MHS family alpha-ketoglutarate permease-like MFS transporter